MIIETEAYLGVHDEASHAWRSRRRRQCGVFAPNGTWYVYRSYGIHWCLNLTAPTADDGAAVLLRAVIPTSGLDQMRRRRASGGATVSDRSLTNGPGKLARAFAITGEQDGMVATPESLLRLSAHAMPACRIGIEATPRIGITRAAEWPLRFTLTASTVARFRPASTRERTS